MMVEITRPVEEPGTERVLRVEPEEIPEQRLPHLRTVLWWVWPATAMLTGSWIAAMVLVAAWRTADPAAVITCGVATAVAVFGGMGLFERLVGTPGAALGAGVTVQLILSPFVENGVVPGWSASAGWVLTALVTGVLIWRAHTRRPPLIRTADAVVTSWDALAELAGAARPSGSGPLTVSGRFRLSGWPRTALQAVELPANPPTAIDAVVSVETRASRGSAFLIRNDGRHADLVTNDHVIGTARSARVSIAGTVRSARLLPRPDPDRFARLLGEHVPHLDDAQRRRLAEQADLRVLRIDSSGLHVAPLEISTAGTRDALALSVGYPHGGVPRFVWPASPVPLPAIGVGRLVLRHGTAELWTPWRVQSGNSGGPVLVREGGRLRVAAVTYVQHDGRRSLGNSSHIPAPVLRAYVAAVDGYEP
ncbi:trypsin-like peptidase domain-containing protein [Pseudonocardia sp. DLS-67]